MNNVNGSSSQFNNPEEFLRSHGISLKSYEIGKNTPTSCPNCRDAHKTKRDCLSVMIEADGRVKWNCHRCGWQGPKQTGNGHDRIKSVPVIYEYGSTLRKVRTISGDPKFIWEHKEDDQWVKGTGGQPTKDLLYRYQGIKAAIDGGLIVCIVEGEKDADTLWKLGIPATSGPHGAGKWTAAQSEALTGADVVVFNDHDEVGIAHAQKVVKSVTRCAHSARWCPIDSVWPEVRDGQDISDWVACGASKDDVLRAIKPQATNGHDKLIDDCAQMEEEEFLLRVKQIAKDNGITIGDLKKLVRARRREIAPPDNDYNDPKAWPDAVDVDDILDELVRLARRFTVLPANGAEKLATWIAFTYVWRSFDTATRLRIYAPEKECGKTTVLDFIAAICWRPDTCINTSTAAFFRSIEDDKPTLLLDELASYVKEDSDIRSVLNGGFSPNGKVKRVDKSGDRLFVRRFSCWAPVAYAYTGELPTNFDQLLSRSISIILKRRKASEKIESMSGPIRRGEFNDLRRRLKRFGDDYAEALAAAEPEIPNGLINRMENNWRPLFAIADLAGEEWGERIRNSVDQPGEEQRSLREQLLSDIRDVFEKHEASDGFLPSEMLVHALNHIEGAPWAESNRGREMTKNSLARMLRADVRPRRDRAGDNRGYHAVDFTEVWDRYLDPIIEEKKQHASPDQPSERQKYSAAPDKNGQATEKTEEKMSDGCSDGCFDQPSEPSETDPDGWSYHLDE